MKAAGNSVGKDLVVHVKMFGFSFKTVGSRVLNS